MSSIDRGYEYAKYASFFSSRLLYIYKSKARLILHVSLMTKLNSSPIYFIRSIISFHLGYIFGPIRIKRIVLIFTFNLYAVRIRYIYILVIKMISRRLIYELISILILFDLKGFIAFAGSFKSNSN